METTPSGVLTTPLFSDPGVLATPGSEPTPAPPPGVECIAPLMVDGGTRFALDLDPEVFEEISSIGRQACRPMRQLLRELRAPTTRAQQKEWAAQGGRTCMLPKRQRVLAGIVSDGGYVGAEVRVSGDRRERLVFFVPDVVHVQVNVETGKVRVQLKARTLWASGYRFVAGYWLSLVLWWFTGDSCTLKSAREAGWVTTGLELCSDYVGLEFSDGDVNAFVGFKSTELVRKFSKDGKLQTINMGTRGSPISLCLYDKDAQLAEVKGGDDSAYRAVHKANGWDGTSPRRRVEFRLTGRGLQFKDEEGDVLDFRDPAMLADREALAKLWAVLCWKKRLVLTESATRRERAKVDPRWEGVLGACNKPFDASYRQTREVQKDTHAEAVRRARRDLLRKAEAVRGLHDIPEDVPAIEVVQFVAETTEREDLAEHRRWGRRYRKTREEFIGEEIRTYGQADWKRWCSRQEARAS